MSSNRLKLFSRPGFWLCAALLLLPFMLTNDSLWIDEGDTAMYALQPDFSSWWQHLRQDPAADCQMPLSMLFAWISGRMLGVGEWQMRAVNLLWGVVTLAGMYRVGRRIQLPWLPVLLAVQPYFWFYMNEARPYALQIACGSWLLVAFVEFLSRKAAGESWAWLLAASTFFLFLSTLLAPVSVAAIVIAGVVVAVLNHWKPNRRALLILLAGAAANIPTAIYHLSTLVRGAKSAMLWHVDLKFFGYVLYELTGLTGLGLSTEEIRHLAKSPHFFATFSAHGWQFALPALGFVLVAGAIIFGLRRQSSGLPPGLRAGLVSVLGLTALTFVAGGLVLQKAFWARHFAPMFPFYVVLLGVALAGLTSRRHRVVRWLPFLVVGLLIFSALNLRFSPVWRKEDYRSAAQFARQALTENKSVWWVGADYCANYYGLECAESRPETGKVFCPQFGGAETLPPPDVIVFSKPDIYDAKFVVQEIIKRDHYQEAARFKSFTVWTNSGTPRLIPP